MISNKNIWKFSNALLDHLELKYPYTVEDVVKKLNGKIVKLPTEIIIYDFIVNKDGDSFIIYINSIMSELSQNHSIAKAIGHLLLHMGYCNGLEKWERSDVYVENYFHEQHKHRNIETVQWEFAEAQCFSNFIQMPPDTFRDICRSHCDDDTYNTVEIAKELGVSVDRVRRHGKGLALFECDCNCRY